MKTDNSNCNIRSAARVLSATMFTAIFAIAFTACSMGTKPVETTNAGSSNSAVEKPPTNSTATSSDLAGTYEVSGTGVDGKTYQGELAVTKRDAVYQLSWKVGAEDYDGIAVKSGNTVAAAYTTGSDGSGCGAVIYKIDSDNSLDGSWGEWGVNSLGTEKATPVGDLSGSVGSFDVTGTNANGSTYKGKLAVTKGGNDVYQFAWDTGSKFAGTGIKMGDYLAAGSGAKECGFVIYEVKGNTLEGKWGVPGSTSLGTEKATKK